MAYDKKLHFIAGLAISIIFGYFFGEYIGFFSSVVAGIAKELRDDYVYGGFDYKDLLWTMMGGFVGAAFLVLVKWNMI